MDSLQAAIGELAAATGFSGVVRVDAADTVVLAAAYGLANRALGIANTIDTQFSIASGAKGFTALAVMRLVEQGVLDLHTTARALLADDLPLIDSTVTIEHLLGHRSGVGEYLNEDDGDINDVHMPRPVHEYTTAEAYVSTLDGHPTAFPPDSAWRYNNTGYVLLGILASRAAGLPYHQLITDLVCTPAGLADTQFIRTDEPTARTAVHYLSATEPRTNVLNLPVLGVGDGGLTSTVADIHQFWQALFDGRIVAPDTVAMMVHPRSDAPQNDARYGLGFWVHRTSDAVFLEGYDSGISFRTVHDQARQLTITVIGNTSEGAWPILRRLDELLRDP